MLTALEWQRLTGGMPRAPSGVAGLSRVGDASNQGFGVSFEQMNELGARVSVLDHYIQNFEFVPSATTTPDEFASAASRIISLRLRWQTWRHLEWEAWRDTHTTSFSRLPGSAAIEFGQLEIQYNSFRQEVIDLGGTPPVPAAQVTPPPGTPSAVDKILELVDSMKWIAIVGLAAYVLVGTGAVAAVGAMVAGRSASRKKD